MLVIDGSYGEGGGQVVRSSVSLAVLLNRPIRVENVRVGRSRPGLQPQHLTAVRAAARICDAEFTGDELGSQSFTLVPTNPPRSGTYVFDVTEESGRGSAGSAGLVIQTILLPLALTDGESVVTIRGGTHVPWAPPATYLEQVLLPPLAQIGISAEIESRRWGFYPAGGGELVARIEGRASSLQTLQLEVRGAIQRVHGTAAAMNLPAHIAQRMTTRAYSLLTRDDIVASIETRRLRGSGPGAGITLVAKYDNIRAGFSAFGRKGLPAEEVAETACQELLIHHRSGEPVEPHLADQLLLPLAFAEGESRLITSSVSQHLLTNAWVVNQFLGPTVSTEGQVGEPGNIIVQGVGRD